jgi:hypothetical protein
MLQMMLDVMLEVKLEEMQEVMLHRWMRFLNERAEPALPTPTRP